MYSDGSLLFPLGQVSSHQQFGQHILLQKLLCACTRERLIGTNNVATLHSIQQLSSIPYIVLEALLFWNTTLGKATQLSNQLDILSRSMWWTQLLCMITSIIVYLFGPRLHDFCMALDLYCLHASPLPVHFSLCRKMLLCSDIITIFCQLKNQQPKCSKIPYPV